MRFWCGWRRPLPDPAYLQLDDAVDTQARFHACTTEPQWQALPFPRFWHWQPRWVRCGHVVTGRFATADDVTCVPSSTDVMLRRSRGVILMFLTASNRVTASVSSGTTRKSLNTDCTITSAHLSYASRTILYLLCSVDIRVFAMINNRQIPKVINPRGLQIQAIITSDERES